MIRIPQPKPDGTLLRPAPRSNLAMVRISRPNGQSLFLQSVSYTNISLTGEGATADVPGTLSATLHTRV
jgi:hypothetical protein